MQHFGTSGVPVTHLASTRSFHSGIFESGITGDEKRRRMDVLLSFASNDGSFGPAELQVAVDHYCDMYGGTSQQMEEVRRLMALTLTVFGHAKGSVHRALWPLSNVLSKDDLEALWLREEWPKGWLDRRRVEWAPFTEIDVFVGIRTALMQGAQATEPASSTNDSFAPWPGNYIDDPTYPQPRGVGGEEPPSSAEIEAGVPGGKLSLFDSRMGGVQPTLMHKGGQSFPDPIPEEYWQPAWKEYEDDSAGAVAWSYVGASFAVVTIALFCVCLCQAQGCCRGQEKDVVEP